MVCQTLLSDSSGAFGTARSQALRISIASPHNLQQLQTHRLDAVVVTLD